MKIIVIIAVILTGGIVMSGENTDQAIEVDAYKERSLGIFDFLTPRYIPVVTDSVVWRTVEVDSTSLGDEECDHIWAYSDTWRAGGSMYCAVDHGGFHCGWDDRMRHRICSRCLRKETQREQWYQHREKKPETDYDRLQREIDKKQQGEEIKP